METIGLLDIAIVMPIRAYRNVMCFRIHERDSERMKETIVSANDKLLTINERVSAIKTDRSSQSRSILGELKNTHQWLARKSTIDEGDLATILSVNGWNWRDFEIAISPEYHKGCLEESRDSTFENLSVAIKNTSTDGQGSSYDYLVRPFISMFCEAFDRIQSPSKERLTAKAAQSLIDALIAKLLQIGLKTFIYELNRLKTEGLLVGKDPNEKFTYFVHIYNDSEKLLKLYETYPVLARKLSVATSRHIDFISKLFSDLDESWGELHDSLLKGSRESSIVDIKLGQGDTHEKGKSVVTIEFDKGRLVYKPRNLEVERIFDDVIEFFSANPSFFEMRLVKSIYFKDFTVSEYIEQKGCDDEKQVAKYFTRYGQLLAIMYLLNGSDAHYENIIANTEYPIIVDLETLFTNYVVFEGLSDTIPFKLIEEMRGSVTSSIMLPTNIQLDAHGNTADMSGLNGEGGVLSIKDYRPDDIETANARFVLDNVVLPESNNAVFLRGKRVDYRNHLDKIIKGFTTTLGYFLKNRDSFLGLVEKAEDCRVRTLVRDTNKYARLLSYTHHPDCLKDFIDVEKVLENLFSYTVKDKRICLAEYRDMLFDDIPIFYSHLDGKWICNSEGDLIEDVFKKTPRECALEKLRNLNEKSVCKQVGLITMKIKGKDGLVSTQRIEFDHRREQDLRADLIFFAEKIASNIVSDALVGGKGRMPQWLTIMSGEQNEYDYGPMRCDYYDGVAGLVLLLKTLYSITNKNFYNDYYERALSSILTQPVFSKTDSSYIGLHSVMRLSKYISRKDANYDIWQSYLERVELLFSQYIEKDELSPDWLVGIGGIVSLYVDLYDVTGDWVYVERASVLASRMLALFEKDISSKSNIGLGHGLSGMIVSLTRLYDITKDTLIYHEICQLADLSKKVAEKNSNDIPVSWCNGMIGYLIASRYLERLGIKDPGSPETVYFRRVVRNHRFSTDCVCHGECGRILYYLDEFELTHETEFRSLAEQFASHLLSRVFKDMQVRIKHFPGFSNWGLFTGMAGVAYTFLRVAEPEKVDTVFI